MARTEDSHAAKLASQDGNQGQGVTDEVDTALPEPGPVVSVRNESPALGTGQCISLSSSSGTVKQVLPQDPRRRHALLLAVDNDVWIAGTKEVAQAAEGSTSGAFAFYLPKGVPVPVINKSAWWVAATTTASTSRVSVMVDKNDG
jgi:hypothetical protein